MLRAQGGAPQGSEFRVNSYTTENQRFPLLAFDSGGNFVVAWDSFGQDGSTHGVFAQRFASSGTPLGGEFRVNTFTPSPQRYPTVACDAPGNFVVTWSSNGQDGSYSGIFGQRFNTSGAPLGGEFRVNTYTTGFQYNSSVASGSAGNFVVAWHSYPQDGSSYGIFAQRYASTGAPLGGEFRVNTYTTNVQAYPRVAADSAGNFVVVWNSYNQDGSGGGVFAQRYASTGLPLGGEFRVNTYTTNTQGAPALAADAAGNFVIVWNSPNQDGNGTGVFAQRYASSGTAVGGEFRVNSYTTGNQSNPSVASDSAGNFVVEWTSYTQDGAGAGVFAQRYSSAGTPLGGEFRVNTYTTSNQFSPVTASDPAGNFVVAWMSGGQDGSLNGVYAQRYSPILPVELQSFRVE